MTTSAGSLPMDRGKILHQNIGLGMCWLGGRGNSGIGLKRKKSWVLEVKTQLN